MVRVRVTNSLFRYIRLTIKLKRVSRKWQKWGGSIAHAQCYNEEVDIDVTQWSSSLRYFTISTPLQFSCSSSEGRDKITYFKSSNLTHIMLRPVAVRVTSKKLMLQLL